MPEVPDPMTPERAVEVADAHIKSWKTDWEQVFDHLVIGTGLSRQEVMWYYMIVQLNLLVSEVTKWNRHDVFKPDCSHCIEQKRMQDIQIRYMERAVLAAKGGADVGLMPISITGPSKWSGATASPMRGGPAPERVSLFDARPSRRWPG